MKRVLDEIADAVRLAGGDWPPGVVVSSIELPHQFRLPITPDRWQVLAKQVACILPRLRFYPDGHWTFPRGCRTIWELSAFVAKQHADWQPAHRIDAKEWREAQVFARVRAIVVDVLNVHPDEVVREARIQRDLGAE